MEDALSGPSTHGVIVRLRYRVHVAGIPATAGTVAVDARHPDPEGEARRRWAAVYAVPVERVVVERVGVWRYYPDRLALVVE